MTNKSNFIFVSIILFLAAVQWLPAEEAPLQNKILPAPELGEKIYALVTVSVANMRCKPEYAAEMATQCLLGSPVKVLDKKSGWYRILTPDNYDCWVNGESITLLTREEFNQWILSPKVIFLPDNGFVLSQPRQDTARVSDLVSGSVLACREIVDGFIAVRFPDGRSGFVPKTHCRDFEDWKKNAVLTGETLVNKAADFMGVPYLWGGTSSKMLDCSGLTKLCFFLNGVIIPRNASSQAEVGDTIDFKPDWKDLQTVLQKGDLLFFGSFDAAGTRKRVSHVGMYMENGFFIHEAGRVHINSLNPENELFDKSLFNRLISVKRLTANIGKKGIVPIAEHHLYHIQTYQRDISD